MNAIEIKGLSKSFHGIYAVQDLDLSVPQGSIYGFIGENGSGKSTTQKLICSLLIPKSGEIRLFGKSYRDADIRTKMGVLIESPGCFPNNSVYDNLMMQALNLGIRHPREEVARVLKLVSMAGAGSRKFKECSLGMKQRLGVAQSLLGRPELLILDEPINGLDADGMRIVRETLEDLNRNEGVTIMISSHILGELSKVATHYGIIRGGTMIRQIPAAALREECRDYVYARTTDDDKAISILQSRYPHVERQEDGIRIYEEEDSTSAAGYLYENGIALREILSCKVGLEEYYLQVMSKKGGNIYE